MELSREAQIMAFVYDYGPSSLGQILDLTRIPPSPAKRILKTLRSRGIIRRSRGKYLVPDKVKIRGGLFAWRRRRERIEMAKALSRWEFLNDLADGIIEGRGDPSLRLYRETLEERLREIELDS